METARLPLFAALLACAGCTSPARVVPAARASAEIVVENHTDQEWRVEFGAREWTISPRETRRINLAGGTYEVSREMFGTEAAGGAEKTTIFFEAGRSYTWPLGTLFSVEEPGR
jgi:hypothetical protein